MKSNNVVLKQEGKFEYLYIKNAIAYYAFLNQPKNKWESTDKEYSIVLFVDDETREDLEDNVLINKQLFKVGVDKTKTRKIKYGLDKFTEVAGLSGITLTLPEFTRAGKAQRPLVVDNKGEIMDSVIVGNGSRVSVKCFGYRNKDNLLVVMLNTVKVEHLVTYEGGTASTYDTELGIAPQETPKQEAVNTQAQLPSDDDIPF